MRVCIPFGRTKTSLSAPREMALESCETCAALNSSLYLVSTNLARRIRMGKTRSRSNTYFLICGRDTPVRASSGCARMHSCKKDKSTAVEGDQAGKCG